MNIETIKKSELPALLAELGGGIFIGLTHEGDNTFANICAGIEGDIEGEWGEYEQDVAGARSYTDGLANTRAMAEAGSEFAKTALALSINGHSDWALPARDVQELQYRHLKPTTSENSCSFRDGDNPSSLPAGYPYTEESPVQTTLASFQEGGKDALKPTWYWSSTQYSANLAWDQGFAYGFQTYDGKYDRARGRVVRRLMVVSD